MPKHTWTNRTVPPLVAIMVVSCVWYALDSRPTPAVEPATAGTVAAGSRPAQPSAPVVASAAPAPQTTPVVKKLGKQLQFSLQSLPYKNVQKVEFYVEKQFVGAAYSQPYTVAVSEDNLTAGTHTVTAKIYSGTATTQSPPASFTAQPAAPPAAAVDSDTSSDTTTSNPANDTPATPPVTQSIVAPNDVSGSSSSNGTSVTLIWSDVTGAASYQILRDGSQVGTANGVGFTDTGLTPGKTYDYQVISVDAKGDTSVPSDPVAVTSTLPAATDDFSKAAAPGPQSPASTDPATVPN